MPSTMDALVERGMRPAAELPEVMPDDDERIRPVYADIQRTLRVPFVNLIFRSLANFPSYLAPAWQLVSPLARTVRVRDGGGRSARHELAGAGAILQKGVVGGRGPRPAAGI